MSQATRIVFYGVRGSHPGATRGPTRIGDNTSCVGVFCGDRLLALDAGTGIVGLGRDVMSLGLNRASVFISHFHWDHIQGLPFFTPLFIPGNEVDFLGPAADDQGLEAAIRHQMHSPYFPVEVRDWDAGFRCRRMGEGDFEVMGVRGEALYLHHPGRTLGYKLALPDGVLVYCPDNEVQMIGGLGPEQYAVEDAALGRMYEEAAEAEQKRFLNFIGDADIVIHDAQYTADEYNGRRGWGHSAHLGVLELMIQARVRHYVMFHHEPQHSDADLEAMRDDAVRAAAGKGSGVRITLAEEGLELGFS